MDHGGSKRPTSNIQRPISWRISSAPFEIEPVMLASLAGCVTSRDSLIAI